MYTNLQHNKIIRSVNWLLDKAKKQDKKRGNKEHNINISNKKPYILRWGKTYGEGKTSLNFKQIRDIVTYDLQHSYTMIGGKVYKQNIGAPMGGLLSTNYANICCAYDEDTFLNKNPTLTPSIFGVRQIDDAIILISYPNDNNMLEKDAHNFINSFTEETNPIYKDGLKCKKQDIKYEPLNDTYNFNFIGTHIQIKVKGKNKPLIQTQCKNWDSLSSKGEQKFLRLVQAHSHTPQRTKNGTIIGEIIRHTYYTDNPILLHASICKLCIELLSIGYKKSYLTRLNTIQIQFHFSWQNLYVVKKFTKL
jgi:hypothetical protein